MNEQYMEYDSIIDDIYNLGKGLFLRMCVKLSNKDKNGNRNYFHKEYRYPSKYIDQSYNRTIKRSYDYYLLLEKKSYADNDIDCYIQIRPNNMIFIQSMLNSGINWLMDDKLYKVKDRRLIIINKPNMVKSIGLPMGLWLGIEPCVIYYENNDTYDKGIRLFLSSEDKFIDISGDSFFGLVYTLSTFNMYECSINLLNYLEKPEMGTNLLTFENESFINNEIEDGVQSKHGRKMNIKKGKSFFDKIDELS